LLPEELPHLSIASARGRFASLINRVAYRGERVLLNRHGRLVAGVVPLSDIQRLLDLDLDHEHRTPPTFDATVPIGEAMARRLEAELGLSPNPPGVPPYPVGPRLGREEPL
jgi:prevent-host-death family protein